MLTRSKKKNNEKIFEPKILRSLPIPIPKKKIPVKRQLNFDEEIENETVSFQEELNVSLPGRPESKLLNT